MTDPPPAGPRTPYVGLVPYGEDDADFFFGRDEERWIVAGNLRADRLTILYGPSGVGKSSLLFATVARSLRALPEAPVVVVFSSWGGDPTEALAAAVAPRIGISGTVAPEFAPV